MYAPATSFDTSNLNLAQELGIRHSNLNSWRQHEAALSTLHQILHCQLMLLWNHYFYIHILISHSTVSCNLSKFNNLILTMVINWIAATLYSTIIVIINVCQHTSNTSSTSYSRTLLEINREHLISRQTRNHFSSSSYMPSERQTARDRQWEDICTYI